MMAEFKSASTCEICGMKFGNSYLKSKHLEQHFYEGKKKGLVPDFFIDASGEQVLRGMKSEWDD